MSSDSSVSSYSSSDSSDSMFSQSSSDSDTSSYSNVDLTLPPPRPRDIQGTCSQRIRLLHGDDVDEWILILTEDDGDQEWQTVKTSKSCKKPLFKKVKKALRHEIALKRWIESVDYESSGSYVIITIDRANNIRRRIVHSEFDHLKNIIKKKIPKRTNIDEAEKCHVALGKRGDGEPSMVLVIGEKVRSVGAPEKLVSTLKRELRQKKNIQTLRLFNGGSFFLEFETGEQLYEHDLGTVKTNGISIADFALITRKVWIIVSGSTKDKFWCGEKVSADLESCLDVFYDRQKRWIRKREREISKWEDIRKHIEVIDEAADDLKHNQQLIEETLVLLPEDRRASLTRKYSPFLRLTEKSTIGGCVVCLEKSSLLAIVPCGHECVCSACSANILSLKDQERKVCPICRGPIERTIRIYRSVTDNTI